MRRIGSTRGDSGSVTIAAAVLLSGILLLNTALYDYAAYKALESRATAGILLACRSVLASYDSLLAEKYGLYGLIRETAARHTICLTIIIPLRHPRAL